MNTVGTQTRIKIPWSLKWLFIFPGLLVNLGFSQDPTPTNATPEWVTNGPAVFSVTNIQSLLRPDLPPMKLQLFEHYVPESLHHRIWTNFITHTNQRTMQIWSIRSHSPTWPAKPPVVQWNTNSLMWGMKGLTAISPCWQDEGSSGQVPITALTRRHGYTRGHGMGPDGIGKNRRGKKVWFLSIDDMLVEATVAREVIRTRAGGSQGDYCILLFTKDLPQSIQPMRVFPASALEKKYVRCKTAPLPIFGTEQSGNVSAGVVGLSVNTWKGGDSGSPNMLPMPNELIFLNGRSTTEPTAAMQSDMDELCKKEGLDPKKYQLQWVDLSKFPSYQ